MSQSSSAAGHFFALCAVGRDRFRNAYEKPLRFAADPAPRYPDFTIDDPATGVMVYWEHCGMLADDGYRERWEAKQKWYRANGVLPAEEGGGPNGTLVVTADDPKTGFDSTRVAVIVRRVLQP